MLENPMAKLPASWLKVYKLWQSMGLFSMRQDTTRQGATADVTMRHSRCYVQGDGATQFATGLANALTPSTFVARTHSPMSAASIEYRSRK